MNGAGTQHALSSTSFITARLGLWCVVTNYATPRCANLKAVRCQPQTSITSTTSGKKKVNGANL